VTSRQGASSMLRERGKGRADLGVLAPLTII